MDVHRKCTLYFDLGHFSGQRHAHGPLPRMLGSGCARSTRSAPRLRGQATYAPHPFTCHGWERPSAPPAHGGNGAGLGYNCLRLPWASELPAELSQLWRSVGAFATSDVFNLGWVYRDVSPLSIHVLLLAILE